MSYLIHIKLKIGQQVVTKESFESLPIVFGRGQQCHFSIPQYTSLSRTHGSITIKDNRLTVTDLNSQNGIFLGPEQVMSFDRQLDEKTKSGSVQFNVPTKTNASEEHRLNFEVTVEYREKPAAVLEETILDPPVQMKTSLPPRVPGFPTIPPPAPAPQKSAIHRHQDHLTKHIRIEEDVNIDQLKKTDISLQGVITWGDDIFDVRQFRPGDEISIGSKSYDPMYLPSLPRKLKFGVFGREKGTFLIPKHMLWSLSIRNHNYSPTEAVRHQLVEERQNGFKFKLGVLDICTIQIAPEISLHFRYVEIPRPLVARTWIENREEFQKAITTSIFVHMAICALAFFSAPKVEAPVVENLPPRYAKLLVEPPPQIMAPKPPEPPPPEPPKPPEPPPEKPIEIVKPVEPPKPIAVIPPKPEKPIVKKPPIKKPDPVKQVVKQPEKPPQKPVEVVNKNQPVPTTAKNSTGNSEETSNASNEMANSFANAFSALPTPGPAAGAKDIKIDNSKGAATTGFKSTGLVGTLKNQVAKGSGMGGLGGDNSNLAKMAGQQGYAKGAGNAGKREVGGAVVGTPKFENPSTPQGLDNNEIMKVVNKHLNDIQRCYERALFQDSAVTGRVEYEWNISPMGSVTDTAVKRSEISNGEFLNSCVLAIFKKMKFPKATNNLPTVANIGFPFGKN